MKPGSIHMRKPGSQGHREPSHLPVSMSDMARELGVSVTTISRALSNHHSIGEATKKAVQDLALKLNYQPNTIASALRKGKSQLIGVIVPYIEGRFFPSVVHSIEIAASKAGYSVIICQSHEDAADERKNVETLLSAQVAGILVSVARGTNDFRHFEKVRKRGIPLVFFDRTPETESVNAVVLNDREGGYETTRHLLEQGCRTIVHLAGMQHLSIYKNRRQGYLDALNSFGIEADEKLIAYTGMTQEEGFQALTAILDAGIKPDGIFSAGDHCALGALQALKARGYRVPEDVAIAGFSNESFTSITEPMLTTVDQRCDEMGQAAIKLFLELVDGDMSSSFRRVVLQPRIVIRESSLHAGAEV